MKLLATGIFLLCQFWSSAQFIFSGEFRPRAEYRHGYKTLLEKETHPAFFIDQRTRLNFKFSSDKYDSKLVIQDVRTWGSLPQLTTSGGQTTTIHEAWVSIKLSEVSALKSGRQEIVLDDARIFGNVAWAQQARSHDGLLLEIEKPKNVWNFAVAFNQDSPKLTRTYYSISPSYKTMQFAWYQTTSEKWKWSFLALNLGWQAGDLSSPKTYFGQTIGTRFVTTGKTFNPSGNVYYQMGNDASGNNVSALEYTAELSWETGEKTKVIFGFEHLSGNSTTGIEDTNRAFNPYFGTNHKFNGLMDFFYVGNHINSVGLNDGYVGVRSQIGNWNFNWTTHAFYTDGQVLDETSNVQDSYLGVELDIVVTHKPSPDIQVQAGYSQMFASETMEILKGGNRKALTNWSFLMLTVKPTFFKSEKDQ